MALEHPEPEKVSASQTSDFLIWRPMYRPANCEERFIENSQKSAIEKKFLMVVNATRSAQNPDQTAVSVRRSVGAFASSRVAQLPANSIPALSNGP
jgi:hypothetical protein